MIRVPMDDVPEDVAHPWVNASRWCDEVRFIRDANGGWWVKVCKVDRSDPSPIEWSARAGWFALSTDSYYEQALDAWLATAVAGVE